MSVELFVDDTLDTDRSAKQAAIHGSALMVEISSSSDPVHKNGNLAHKSIEDLDRRQRNDVVRRCLLFCREITGSSLYWKLIRKCFERRG